MNIQKLTEQYILEHPSLLDCVKKGIINYSKLSREICKEMDIKAFDAVLIACRRCYTKLRGKSSKEDGIMEILKKSKIKIKNKRVVVVLEKNVFYDNIIELEKDVKKNKETLHVIDGENAITLITSDEFYDKIKKLFHRKILSTKKNLAEISIKSPKELETTPGVMAYLYSLFAQNNINIIETMSCWTDTLLVINDREIAKTLNTLSFHSSSSSSSSSL